MRWPYADAVTSPIHERDIAAVAVRALCADRHAGAKYILTGPQSLSQQDQVQIIGDVIGRSLRFEQLPPDVARREMTARMTPLIVDMLLNAWPKTLAQPAPVTSTVAEITGTLARSFRDWVGNHASEFSNAAAHPAR